MAVEAAGVLQLGGGQNGADFGFGGEIGQKFAIAAPRFQRSALDGFIGLLALEAFFGQLEQDRLAGEEAARFVHVGPHIFGMDLQSADKFGQQREHVVEQGARVGQDDALGAAVADIALVPQRDILQCGDGVAADNTGQPAQALAGDRIAFVRHGRAAFLSFGEKFLHLENFGALQMTEFGGPAVNGTGGEREDGHEFRVAVALDDLRGECGGLKSELGADLLFDARIEMRTRADRAAQFAHGDALAHFDEAFAHAAEFVIHQRHLEAEGDRLGVDAVAAPHHGRELVRAGLIGCGGADIIDALDEEVAGRGHLHGKRGVEHVG